MDLLTCCRLLKVQMYLWQMHQSVPQLNAGGSLCSNDEADHIFDEACIISATNAEASNREETRLCSAIRRAGATIAPPVVGPAERITMDGRVRKPTGDDSTTRDSRQYRLFRRPPLVNFPALEPEQSILSTSKIMLAPPTNRIGLYPIFCWSAHTHPW